MKQKTLLGIFAFSIVAILGLSVVSAFGFGQDFMNHGITQEEKTEMQNEMETMKTAIENNDYETWKSLMEEQIEKMQAQITEENFNQIVEMHQKMEEVKEACEEEDNCPMKGEDFGQRMHKGEGKCPMLEPPIEESSE